MNKQTSTVRNLLQGLLLFFSTTVLAIASFAQDKKVDVDINTNKSGSGFWGNPIVWVVGAAVFILLLVAILRSGRRSD